MAVAGLERVADVGEGGSVREGDLPVGADAWEQRAVQLGAREGPAGQGHDAPVALCDIAEIEWRPARRFEAVDARQRRPREQVAHPEAIAGSLWFGSCSVKVTRSQSA